MDVRPEHLDAPSFVCLEQWRAGEADQGGLREDLLHRPVQLACLGSVTLVHEHEDVALGVKTLGKGLLDLLDEVVHVA